MKAKFLAFAAVGGIVTMLCGFVLTPPQARTLALKGDFDTALFLEAQTSNGQATTAVFPLLTITRTPYVIELSGARRSGVAPASAAIQVKGADRCLVEYNGTCIIAGHKLTIQ